MIRQRSAPLLSPPSPPRHAQAAAGSQTRLGSTSSIGSPSIGSPSIGSPSSLSSFILGRSRDDAESTAALQAAFSEQQELLEAAEERALAGQQQLGAATAAADAMQRALRKEQRDRQAAQTALHAERRHHQHTAARAADLGATVERLQGVLTAERRASLRRTQSAYAELTAERREVMRLRAARAAGAAALQAEQCGREAAEAHAEELGAEVLRLSHRLEGLWRHTRLEQAASAAKIQHAAVLAAEHATAVASEAEPPHVMVAAQAARANTAEAALAAEQLETARLQQELAASQAAVQSQHQQLRQQAAVVQSEAAQAARADTAEAALATEQLETARLRQQLRQQAASAEQQAACWAEDEAWYQQQLLAEAGGWRGEAAAAKEEGEAGGEHEGAGEAPSASTGGDGGTV